jgi:hypothetical protein
MKPNTKQVGSSGNASDFYSGDARFELPMEHRISWKDRVIAQAVSRRLPTAAASVRSHIRSFGICGWQSDNGIGFLRVLRFPLPILTPPTAPHSSPGAGTTDKLMTDTPSELMFHHTLWTKGGEWDEGLPNLYFTWRRNHNQGLRLALPR